MLRSFRIVPILTTCLFIGTAFASGASGAEGGERGDEGEPSLIEVAPHGHYDELYGSQGSVRPQQRVALEVAKSFDRYRLKTVATGTLQDFETENRLLAMPLMITEDELRYLQKGVRQRLRGFHAFLTDYQRTGGRPRVVSGGQLPGPVLEQIVTLSREQYYSKTPHVSRVNLFYGPDIIRGIDGHFYVVEDNIGPVASIGGTGDLELQLKSLYKNVPEFLGLHDYSPDDFYRRLFARFHERAARLGGVVVFYSRYSLKGSEAGRLSELAARYGITTVSADTRSQIMVNSKGVWLRRPSKSPLERVGFIMDGDQHEPSHRAARAAETIRVGRIVNSMESSSAIAEEWRALSQGVDAIGETNFFARIAGLFHAIRRSPYAVHLKWQGREQSSGLANAILTGKVESDYTPGLGFANNKLLYSFVETFIRFYLGEEPILRSIPTYDPMLRGSHGQPLGVDRSLVAKVEANPENYVVKSSRSVGGEGVIVLPKVSRELRREASLRLRSTPHATVVQDYIPPSSAGGYIVDRRPYAEIDASGDVFVGDILWGRALPHEGDGRLNISQRGVEAVWMAKRARSSTGACALLFEWVRGAGACSRGSGAAGRACLRDAGGARRVARVGMSDGFKAMTEEKEFREFSCEGLRASSFGVEFLSRELVN